MSRTPAQPNSSWGAVCVALLAACFLVAVLTVVGADLMWLVAMGDAVRSGATVLDAVPFAAAPSDGWPPVLLLAEVALSLLHELGLAGLLVWHYLAVAVTLVVVAVDARRRGASDMSTALVLGVLLLGAISVFAVARLQTFSLVPFVLTLLLVRAQTGRPGRAMWWAPALVVVWGNLHGSVLLGVCVIGAHLLFCRLTRRPGETVLLGVATLAALFVTPATWRTGEYYLGVMQNEAAARGEGLWAAPNLADPFDLLMFAAAVVLGVLALRRRLPLWEYVALAGLALATIVAARNGIWLVLFLAAPAAANGRRDRQVSSSLEPPSVRALAACLVVVSACAGLLAYRAGVIDEESRRFAAEVEQAAPGAVVLAPEPVVESLVVHGVRVWLSNPLDAFDQGDQRAYLDFMEGRPGMVAAVRDSGAVLVQDDSPADEVMADLPGFDVRAVDDVWLLYVRDQREPSR